MSGYLAKLIVIFGIAAVGAGVHLGSSWPVKLKATPDQPPPLTLNIPSRTPAQTEISAPPVSETPVDDAGEPEGAGENAEQPAEASGSSGGQIVLDSLEIGLDTTRALHENDLATFVDARPAAEYEKGHIEGAMNISPQMLEADASLFVLDVIDPAKVLVIYCGGGDCDDSFRVAELLQDLRGFEQTHVFVDGFPVWEAAGLPTSSGPDPWAE